MIVFTKNITPRLQYISDFIGKEITGDIRLTQDAEYFKGGDGPKINYSNERITEDEFLIKPQSLLFEKNIHTQTVNCFEVNGHKAFFKTDGDLPFDIFAASFYLLTRYEEYLPHQKDSYGRYSHENSLAFKENFLHLPLINIWLENFKKALQSKFPAFPIHHSPFTFLPTYDIDEAWSYKHKPIWRTIGGLARSMVNGRWTMVKERIKVLNGKMTDPFDAYEWMDELHRQYKLRPHYFFHVAKKNRGYDKNILPSKKAMEDLILDHSNRYSIGIHPSWQSGDDPVKLKYEILRLGHISGRPITSSRQHYIRFTLPGTYRQLIEDGIESEYSMGYGSINGFRASVASLFYWYDLEKEETTKLLIHPFCFMDANSFFEQKFSPQQALNEMLKYYQAVRSVNGVMITIWHNTFLGTSKLFAGWREVYEKFVKEVAK